jgi:uncharacterized protein (TIGR02145 family)
MASLNVIHSRNFTAFKINAGPVFYDDYIKRNTSKKRRTVIFIFLITFILLIGCKEKSASVRADPPEAIFEISTVPITEIKPRSAKSGGEITGSGNSQITERGVCWSETENPAVNDNCTMNGSGTGSYSSTITGLSPGIQYHVRAYAIISESVQYGGERIFTTISDDEADSYEHEYGSLTDIEGNEYKTIIIGEQEWMAENLKTSRYRDSTSIAHVAENGEWRVRVSGAWSYYGNDISNGPVYGKLYNWYAVADGRGLCPSGWRVPADEDWTVLEMYLGMSHAEAKGIGWRGGAQNTGGKLKETGLEHWRLPNAGATNESGFSGLPGGIRDSESTFVNINTYGFWWSSAEQNESNSWRRVLRLFDGEVNRSDFDKREGYSVRCLRN